MIYKYAAIALLIMSLVWAIDDFGYDRAESKWSKKWISRELEITAANMAHAEKLLDLQAELQKFTDGVSKNGTEKRNDLESDITDGRDAFAGVRDKSAEYAASAEVCPGNTNSAGNSKAAVGPAVVLAKLLSSCEQRAAELAAAYDKAKIAGDSCVAYADGIRDKLSACNK